MSLTLSETPKTGQFHVEAHMKPKEAKVAQANTLTNKSYVNVQTNTHNGNDKTTKSKIINSNKTNGERLQPKHIDMRGSRKFCLGRGDHGICLVISVIQKVPYTPSTRSNWTQVQLFLEGGGGVCTSISKATYCNL